MLYTIIEGINNYRSTALMLNNQQLCFYFYINDY